MRRGNFGSAASPQNIPGSTGRTVTPILESAPRPMAAILILLIRTYQLLLRPLLGQRCRFHPSCSSYAVAALQRHGTFRGCWLTLRRLMRCHPLNPGGFDPVPDR